MWSLWGLGLSLPNDVISLVCTKWLGWDSLLADTYIPTIYTTGKQFLIWAETEWNCSSLNWCHMSAPAHLGVSQGQKLCSLSSVWHTNSQLAHRNTAKLARKGRTKYPWRCTYEICFPDTYLIGQGGPLDHPSSPSVHHRPLQFHLASLVFIPKAVNGLSISGSKKAVRVSSEETGRTVVLPTPEALDIVVYCVFMVCPNGLRRWTKLYVAKLSFKNPSRNISVSPCEPNFTRNSLHILELIVMVELWMWLKMF